MAWRRQWCHLCELPKPPWAVVGDFSQAVCRACANLEGAGRVELLLATARRLRGRQGTTGALSPLSPSVPRELREALCIENHLRGRQGVTGALSPLSPGVPRELRETLYTEHGQCGATSLALSPNVPKELREALYTEHRLQGHHEATLSPNVPTELSQALCGRVPCERRLRRRHHRDVTLPLAVSPSVPTELSRHHGTRAVSPSVPTELSGALCGRVTLEETERRHHATTPLVPAALQRHHGTSAMSPSVPMELSRHHGTTPAMSPSVPMELSRHHGTTPAMSPSVPAALQRHHGATPAMSPAASPAVPAALSAALAAAWPGKPRAVRERLSVLAGCAPFAVRFRKDHALVGRVLAFDAAPRAGPGGDFELRLFAEYPCGSGSVYGALGLARRMFQDCVRASGRSISSGYKYLEYEKRQGSGEWRLLAELFTESVRFFRRPPSPEALPQQQRGHLSVSPLSPLSPLSPSPRRRRKAAAAGSALSCGRCRRLLEDTHFVQCPAVPRHRFCFPCARRAIRARGPGGAVHCPSGGRCPLGAAGPPWAFVQAEINAILAGDVRVKRERDPWGTAGVVTGQ